MLGASYRAFAYIWLFRLRLHASYLLHSDLAREPHIPTAAAHKHLKLSAWNRPAGAIPDTQISPLQRERGCSRCTRCQLELAEAPKLFGRRVGARWVADVQLRHFGTSDAAAVGDFGRHGRDCLPEVGWTAGPFGTSGGTGSRCARHSQVGVGEVGVC